MAWVYILKSQKDNHLYVGSTNDLDRRILQHNSGLVKATKHRRPLVLYASQEFDLVEQAAACEKKYKRSHGFRERMIKSDKLKLATRGGVCQ